MRANKIWITIRGWLAACLCLCLATNAQGQCKLSTDVVDEFDSTRLVTSQAITVGYLIPSRVETASGPKMVEEAKLMFTFTQNDSIDVFFITLAALEREYLPIEKGYNVLLLLSSKEVVPLYNVPDRGQFDAKSNMRVYQHTCIVPLDLFYNLTHHDIDKIRIEYRGSKHTISLLPEQQEAVRRAVRCVGEAVNLFPVKP
jgi:hypothetical protein